jgi:hypothetical protein
MSASRVDRLAIASFQDRSLRHRKASELRKPENFNAIDDPNPSKYQCFGTKGLFAKSFKRRIFQEKIVAEENLNSETFKFRDKDLSSFGSTFGWAGNPEVPCELF